MVNFYGKQNQALFNHHREKMLRPIELRKKLGSTVGAPPPKHPSGVLWPNGEFSYGMATDLTEVDIECERFAFRDNSVSGSVAVQPECLGYLTSSNGPNSHTEDTAGQGPARRGLKGLTGYGKKMLRSGCYVLERDYGNQDLCFATLTVPALSPAGRRRLAENWSELLRQSTQWIGRQLAGAGRPTKVCGCVEVQTRRLEDSGQAYLHLHLVWPSHSNRAGERWAITWADMRAWWASAIVRFSGEKPAHLPRVELAPVRKSCESYMAKYVSKGSDDSLDAFIADVGEDAVPSTWWFMSADLRHQVKDEMSQGKNTGTLLDAFVQRCFEEGDFSPFVWIRHVEVQMGDSHVTVGWVGKLRPEHRDELLGMLSPLR